MITLQKAPHKVMNYANVIGVDTSRRVIATVGDVAYVEDTINGQRVEYKQVLPCRGSFVIDGRHYLPFGPVALVKREDTVEFTSHRVLGRSKEVIA